MGKREGKGRNMHGGHAFSVNNMHTHDLACLFMQLFLSLGTGVYHDYYCCVCWLSMDRLGELDVCMCLCSALCEMKIVEGVFVHHVDTFSPFSLLVQMIYDTSRQFMQATPPKRGTASSTLTTATKHTQPPQWWWYEGQMWPAITRTRPGLTKTGHYPVKIAKFNQIKTREQNAQSNIIKYFYHDNCTPPLWKTWCRRRGEALLIEIMSRCWSFYTVTGVLVIVKQLPALPTSPCI